MLKNRIIGEKIRNIVILLMAIAIMLGAYRYIDKSRAENVIEIVAIALDSNGYLSEEEFTLEANEIEENSYEIRLPESINTKKINQIVKVTLENIADTNTQVTSTTGNSENVLEIVENRVYLTNEQIENQQLKLELQYDIKELQDSTKLYNKILTYEDATNNKAVQLNGYLPVEAEIQVEEVTQQQLVQIFGDKKIDVAYDIKIVKKVITTTPTDEADPDATPEQIVETIEINPEDFGEKCEVSIKDANISQNSEVYHVKDDNTYEQVTVTQNVAGSINFEAQTFSIYAVYAVSNSATLNETNDEGTTIGETTGTTSSAKPSELFDANGTNVNGLHIGDFVNYDAGTWTSTEISNIKTGLKTSLVTASTSLPTGEFQFGGFAASLSRNENAALKDTTCDYVKDASTNKAITGWRVFDIDGDTVTLISAGNPEDYNHPYGTNYAYISEYILTGNVNNSWSASEAGKYQKREWNNYVNTKQKAESATVLTKSKLDNWYTKYTNIANADTYTGETFRMIYQEPYTKYQNMIDNYSYYWLSSAINNQGLYDMKPSFRIVNFEGRNTFGVRVLVTLSSDVLFSTEKAGTKTITGGNMDTYGGHQTYNVWNIASGDDTVVDEIAPTLTVSQTSCIWRNSALNVTINHDDLGGSGIASTSGSYFLSTSTTPTTVETGAKLSGTYTSGTEFSINPGTSGTYYLFVKEIADNAGNKSSTDATDTVTIGGAKYHRYGTYQFDYDNPTWSYVSKDIYYSTANDVGNDNYANVDRKVVITFKGKDVTTNATSTLTSDAITVSVNGTVVPNANKKLTTTNNNTKEVTCVLEITGITENGALKVVIPSDTLTDQATNKNVQTELTTDVGITIDNTNPSVSLAVTSPVAGKYKAGQTVTITATYNENVYKEITSNNLIDTISEAPAMELTFGGTAAKGTVTCSGVSGKVITYTYTIQGPTSEGGTDGDNGALAIKSLGKVYDAAGNGINASNVTPSVSIVADTTIPTLTVSQTLCTWRDSALNVTITNNDIEGSGIASTSGSYFLSTSTTPAAVATGTALSGTYTSGTEFSINPGTSGTYYLFVKEIADKAGNKSSTGATDILTIGEAKYHRYGTYQFDYDKPIWSTQNINIDKTNKTVTVDLVGTDEITYTSNSLAKEEITVYIDGVVASNIQKSLSEPTLVTNGVKYTLTLSGFEELQSEKSYLEWSGTVSIDIAAGTIKDAVNHTNDKQSFVLGFADFIKPKLKYTHQTTDMNTGTKTYTMTFDITDKYYTSGQLTPNDLTILMQNGKVDENGEEIEYDLKQLATDGKIDISLTPTEKTATFNKTVGGVVKNGTYPIGHTYTLTISRLEQLENNTDSTTADYSGIVTVMIPENKIKDNGPTGDGTNPNGNVATTITSGVNISGGSGTGSENGVAVDVVEPRWTKVSSTASAIDPDNKASSIATITFKGTDTYFKESTLKIDDVKVIVDGSEVTTGIEKALDATKTKELKEDRIVNGVNKTVQYGVQYTVTIKGFAQNANQVKIQIPEGKMTDQTGNVNKATDMIVYNTLKYAGEETAETSPFLGESLSTTIYPTGLTKVTPIARQDIERVEFVKGIADSKAPEVQRVWDVSAQGDKSIIAWTNNTSAPYTVYVGSNDEIFANQDSSNLFSYIGYAENCTATEAVTKLNLLNVKSVTNMASMFRGLGYTAMTSLTLPETFDTSNVTDMSTMFDGCGYKKLTSLDLSSASFNTKNVQNMHAMFNACGVNSMTSLNLGNEFDTNNVTMMHWMFAGCGRYSMTSLDLGDKFDTRRVTTMRHMFSNCGYWAMTKLDLRDKFDTSNVINMDYMFWRCGYEAMTSLDLGDKFDTSKVRYMDYMFYECGYKAMTTLDLGPAFIQIPTGTVTNDVGNTVNAYDYFITDTGASGCTIYAPESIYKNKNAFKLSSTDTTETPDSLKFTTGTIKPIYKPEWKKVSNTIDLGNKTLSVTVKGSAYQIPQVIDSNVTINYASDVTSTLALEDITVFIDGEEVTSTVNPTVFIDGEEVTSTKNPTVALDEGTTSTNATTGKNEVTYTITLSNLEEAIRQSVKKFKEWSGNIAIRIGGRREATDTYTANVLTDSYGNQNMMQTDENGTNADGTWINVAIKDENITSNTEGKMFLDYIKPEFTYIYSEADIDKTNKTVKVVFDVTDKYFANTSLATDSNASLITVKVAEDEAVNNAVTKTLTKTHEIILNTQTNTVTTQEAGYTLGENERKIGERYELLIEKLEQTPNDGFKYSGTVSLGFEAGIIEDTSGNQNNATKITIGVNDTDGNTQDVVDPNGVIVDLVDPVWTRVSSTAYAIDPDNKESSTATITFRGTDKYFKESTLTIDDIKVVVNGEEVTDLEAAGITKTLDSTETVQNGVEYTVTIKGFAQNANQVKVRIPAGKLTDESGNSNKATDLIVYNTLRYAGEETAETSPFLGESLLTTIYPTGLTEVTPIARQDIERVEFASSIAGSKAPEVQRIWDVSAQGDKSIIAWTEQTQAPYTVYIGSNDEIFANQDSGWLFKYIGYGTSCKATEAVTNLKLLNVKSVRGMRHMFSRFGRTSMTSLVLPDTFDTSNVNDMYAMFADGCGSNSMTNFDLGPNFDTSNVTNMNWMFNRLRRNINDKLRFRRQI